MRKLILAALTATSPLLAQPFAVRESAAEITIKNSGYDLVVTRSGFGLRAVRGGRTVLESGPGNLSFHKGGKPQNIGKLTAHEVNGDTVVLHYDTTFGGATARIELQVRDAHVRVTTAVLHSDGDLSAVLSYKLAPSGFWYGGGFQGWREPQIFPLNEARIAPRWFLAQGNTQGTPAWYATGGVGIWVRNPHDFRYSLNAGGNGLLTVEMPAASSITHDILLAHNVREVVDRIIREVGAPAAWPPVDYFTNPVYTTWVEHKVPVDQQKVLEFARAIRKHNLPAGIIEIDDKWEARYGDMVFDPWKFPNVPAMNDELKRMGFKVTLWVHPFVNTDSDTFRDAAMRPLLLADSTGKPGLIKWWNGPAAVWDLTNPKAAEEFRSRLNRLLDLGFAGFKFDGGDVNLVPRDMRPHQPVTPAQYPDVYNEQTTVHYQYQETRVGVLSQRTGAVQRLIDKHSVWGKENGLAAIVPEAITVSMRGFFYVMPDMVGGNQYDGDKIDKELMIRWAQASALMPLLQFSVGPWHFDDETVRLCREASELHMRVFNGSFWVTMVAGARRGEPILRPLWYNYPDDPETFATSDQFMIRDDLMTAPVVAKGAISRRLYLPKGDWIDLKTRAAAAGGKWIDYPAPLDTLPVFIRRGSPLEAVLLK